MAKRKTVYICQNCGTGHEKWQGQCRACDEWNSLVEEVVDSKTSKAVGSHEPVRKVEPRLLEDIDDLDEKRFKTQDEEINRVLGGGIVPGSIILLGGEPGIGKSTLMLQLALQLKDLKILYVSGEESEKQIKMRANRIRFDNPQLYLAGETRLESILKFRKELQPDLLIVDSIQTVYTDALESAPGSVSQVRECAHRLMRLAKENGLTVFVIGHITKEGSLAGPKILEHMVDTVLTFEGERNHNYRIVRTSKNRFGSTLEIGIYEMTGTGLREVHNPSEIFLSGNTEDFSGIAISATMEGMRPLLIETQSLVSPMAYGNAQRAATGYDLRRLNMLLAVLEKRAGFQLGNKDVFVNIAGGLKVEDPALDLGLIAAIVSSMHDLPIDKGAAFSAEVGLSGEIRAVTRIEQRIAEAEKLGFKRFYLSKNQLNGLELPKKGIELLGFSRLEEFFRELFG